LTVTVTPTVTGILTNTALVAGNEYEINPEDNAANVTTSVLPVINLALHKSASSSQLFVGQPLTYTLAVTNSGPSPATGVVVTDSLPVGVTPSSMSPGCILNQTIVCTIPDLMAAETAVLTITVIPATTGFLTNTAIVVGNEFEANDADNEAQVAVEALPLINLSVGKSASPAEVVIGRLFTYTLTITNAGPSPATQVVMTDVLPANMMLVGMTAGCAGDQLVVCDVGTLAVEETAVLTLTVVSTMTGAVTNTAVVMGHEFDSNLENNEAAAVTTILPASDLALHKSASATAVPIGRLLTYTLTITNAGPSLATQVVMTDVLPANALLVGATAGCSGDTTVVCQISDLEVGETAVLTLTVMPTAAGDMTNIAQATAAEVDDNLANNQSQATTSVLLEMLTVQLNGPTAGTTGQSMTFTAVVAPITATQPITYIWQATGQAAITHTNGLTDSVDFVWVLPGPQSVSVTAINRWGQVTAVLAFTIDSRLYLPVVLAK
jgi:uncharacterized repeat protein (TIGR01451 family)